MNQNLADLFSYSTAFFRFKRTLAKVKVRFSSPDIPLAVKTAVCFQLGFPHNFFKRTNDGGEVWLFIDGYEVELTFHNPDMDEPQEEPRDLPSLKAHRINYERVKRYNERGH